MRHTGKFMIAAINGVVISGNYAWTMDENADELDGTTAEDLGFENPSDGVYSGTISLKGYMDIETGNYTVVRRGTQISNLQLFRNVGDPVPAFAIPSAIVLNSTQGGEVRGKIEWTARAKSQGEYTYSDP